MHRGAHNDDPSAHAVTAYTTVGVEVSAPMLSADRPGCETGRVSGFDSLQSGSFLADYDRGGCETRLRAPEPSPERNDMDAKVLAVGGDWVPVVMRRSESVGGGRMFRRAQPQQYAYRIPTPAFS